MYDFFHLKVTPQMALRIFGSQGDFFFPPKQHNNKRRGTITIYGDIGDNFPLSRKNLSNKIWAETKRKVLTTEIGRFRCRTVFGFFQSRNCHWDRVQLYPLARCRRKAFLSENFPCTTSACDATAVQHWCDTNLLCLVELLRHKRSKQAALGKTKGKSIGNYLCFEGKLEFWEVLILGGHCLFVLFYFEVIFITLRETNNKWSFSL